MLISKLLSEIETLSIFLLRGAGVIDNQISTINNNLKLAGGGGGGGGGARFP